MPENEKSQSPVRTCTDCQDFGSIHCPSGVTFCPGFSSISEIREAVASNYHTDQLIDLLNLQDKSSTEMCGLADLFRRRQRLIRAHLAAHGQQIDFGRVLSGRQGGA